MSTLERTVLSANRNSICIKSDEPGGEGDQVDLALDGLAVEDKDEEGRDSTSITQAMSRGWSGNTGPKGVLLDFKASHGKSGAILGGNALQPASAAYPPRPLPTISSSAHGHKSPSSSGSESDLSPSDQGLDPREDLYGSTKTTTRLTLNHRRQQSAASAISTSPKIPSNHNDPKPKKLFGHLREVGVENFIHSIEAEKHDSDTIVLVHLYDPAIESCVVLNGHLSNLARAYPRTKFLRALASELDVVSGTGPKGGVEGRFAIPSVGRSPERGRQPRNLMDEDPFEEESGSEEGVEARSRRATDTDVLPTLIWYRAGQYVQSLPRFENLLPHARIDRGELGCKDVEVLLKKNGIIT